MSIKRVKTGVNTNYLQTYVGGIDDRMVLIVNQKSSAPKALDNEGNATNRIASSTINNSKVNGDGKIDVTNTASSNEIIQENHYYAFGERACSSHPIWLVGEVKRSFRPAEQRGAISEVKTLCAIAKVLLRETHEGPWLMNDAAKDNGYQYNGKELNGDHGLAWYNYGARFYDATIGSWSVVDPMSEAAHGWNPYRYGFNNPMRFVDPSGMIEEGKVPGGEEEERTIDLANRTVYIGYGEKKDERSNVMVIPSAYSPNDTQSSTGNANCVCGCPGARPCFAPNGTGQEFFADF